MSRTDVPGRSDSARATESVQVSMAADGISAAETPICCHLRTKRSRYARQSKVELATTAEAWASASGSRPSVSTRSIAPRRWAGFVLSHSVRQLMASRALKSPTGMTCVPGRPAAMAGWLLVTSRRPAIPAGHNPSR